MRARALAAFFCALTVFLLKPPEPAKAQANEWPVLTCSTLGQCLDLLQKPFPCGPGCPGGDQQGYDFIDADGGYFSLPSQFEKFGRAGVLALLGLLEHPDLSIRARAGMVLSELSTIKPEDLPAILQESRNGNGSIDPALARIGTPEALSELVSLLKKTPDLETQHGGALKSLANKIMPLLLEALSCKAEHDCSTDFVRVIGELASQRGIQSDQIRDRLIDIATTREQFTATRLGALQALAPLKPTKEADRSRIRILLNDPEAKVRGQTRAVLVAWADELAPWPEPSDCAFSYTKHDNSGKLVSEGCETYAESPPSVLKEVHLQNIGAIGPAGRKRTPYVLELLKDENWDVRAKAAKTLSLIGETSAIPYLIDAISARDWKLTLEAMTSLKKLKASEADRVLENVAKTYWHPAIAGAARDLLAGRHTPVLRLFSDEIRNYCEVRADLSLLPQCHKTSETIEEQWRINQEHVAYDERFEQEFLANPVLKDAKPLGVTLEVAAGKFTGTNNGEFVGELTFSDGKARQIVLKENILAVAKIRGRILVVTGLNHMTTNEGFIFEVTKWSGQWVAQRLWRLPAAPHLIVMAPDETLGIFGSSGSVLYGKDDTLQWLACGPSYDCRRY